jgi:hypothetical protein
MLKAVAHVALRIEIFWGDDLSKNSVADGSGGIFLGGKSSVLKAFFT